MSLTEEIDKRISGIQEVQQAWYEMYRSRFSEYFKRVKELERAYMSKSNPVSDSDLEAILTELPLTLFSVSEALNQLKLEYEVMKLENRRKRVEYRENAAQEIIEATELDIPITKSEAQQHIDNSVVRNSTTDDIVVKIYETVISRVESEISSTKELIMAAKKLWDSRRSADESNPISEVVSELPDYTQVNVGTYRASAGLGSVPIGTTADGTYPGKDYIK